MGSDHHLSYWDVKAVHTYTLSEQEFERFQQFIFNRAGISLSAAKKALVNGRLAARLRARGLSSFSEYLDLLGNEPTGPEVQTAVDLLTTNETYFFREPRHFEFLVDTVLPTVPKGRPLRLWSAACSNGAEPYSAAMQLDTHFSGQWEILASDISLRMLEQARKGLYRLDAARGIPKTQLHRYCLRGVGEQEGTFLVRKALRQRVIFRQINLVEPFPFIGCFDAIFLRNVMIYFDTPTKRQVIESIIDVLKPGGFLFVGHSETLMGVNSALRSVGPSVYRKPLA